MGRRYIHSRHVNRLRGQYRFDIFSWCHSVLFPLIKDRLAADKPIRMLHAMMGINTENGELQDAFKKYLFYGRPLDVTNIVEEMGDLMWYVGLLCDVLHIDLEQVMDINIKKLKTRYPGKFTEQAANERDLDKERELLDKARLYTDQINGS